MMVKIILEKANFQLVKNILEDIILKYILHLNLINLIQIMVNIIYHNIYNLCQSIYNLCKGNKFEKDTSRYTCCAYL